MLSISRHLETNMFDLTKIIHNQTLLISTVSYEMRSLLYPYTCMLNS